MELPFSLGSLDWVWGAGIGVAASGPFSVWFGHWLGRRSERAKDIRLVYSAQLNHVEATLDVCLTQIEGLETFRGIEQEVAKARELIAEMKEHPESDENRRRSAVSDGMLDRSRETLLRLLESAPSDHQVVAGIAVLAAIPDSSALHDEMMAFMYASRERDLTKMSNAHINARHELAALRVRLAA